MKRAYHIFTALAFAFNAYLAVPIVWPIDPLIAVVTGCAFMIAVMAMLEDAFPSLRHEG